MVKRVEIESRVKNGVTYKTCIGCDEELVLDDFDYWVYGCYKKQIRCKECIYTGRGVEKEVRGRPSVDYKIIDNKQHKRCILCKNMLPLDSYTKHGTGLFGKESTCKKCLSSKKRKESKRVIREIDGVWHKDCSKCEILLPESFFYKGASYLDRAATCKKCIRSSSKKDSTRDKYLKRKYNISLEEYNQLLEKQNGVCAICHRAEKDGRRLAVDHDHSCCASGKSCGKCIRGLLCIRCNVFILENSRENFIRGLAYLDKYNNSVTVN